jgi:hypothetical protein
MNMVIVLGSIVALIAGFAEGQNKMEQCKRNNSGVKSSSGFFSFLFIDT